MEDPKEAPMAEPNHIQPALCEECKLNSWKYKCPGCSIRSCSLPCVKAHKERTGCTGKRQLTQFVPLSQFDDNLLLSDYTMLEDVKRVAESARRTRFKLCGYSHFRLPFPLQNLRRAAGSRRIKLLFHASGMSKRVTNRSYCNRKKFICWTIEWRFHSTDVVLIDHGVHENANLNSVIEKHLQPGPWNHRLRQFCEEPLDSLKFFIRTNPEGPRPLFRELDIKVPIRQQLANLVILEYPVIYVFLPSHSHNFEIVKKPIPSSEPKKEPSNHNYPSPKGVTFREEEIEDSGSLDPQVLDLMKHVEPYPVIGISNQDGKAEKRLIDTLDRSLLSDLGEVTKPVTRNEKVGDEFIYSGSDIKEPGFFEDMDFVFDQGLLDAYSDLIAETNPDDFLDLEGVLNEEVQLQARNDHADLIGVSTMEDELEEGEIPG